MRNLVGQPVVVGAIQMRAATGYTYGGSTYIGLVQRWEARDRWSPGMQCRHRHRDAESALACAQSRVDDLMRTVPDFAADVDEAVRTFEANAAVSRTWRGLRVPISPSPIALASPTTPAATEET